jgi:hypothetical protein
VLVFGGAFTVGGRGGETSASEGVGVGWWVAAVVHCHLEVRIDVIQG